jgi:integrase
MKNPEPFWRESKKAWYIQLGNSQRSLGKDKKAAIAKANKLLREHLLAQGITPTNGCTLHELVDEYAQFIQKNRAPSHYNVKQYFLRDIKVAFPATLPAEKIAPIKVENFINAMEGVKSPTTKREYIGWFIGIYNWGRRYGMVAVNPLQDMERPAARVRQDFIPADRFAELFDVIPHQTARDFILVMLESGCRTQEMFKATAKNFDGEKFTFIIHDSKGRKRSRVVFLPERAREVVARLAAETPKGPIFLNSEGTPWNKNSINCLMIRLKKKFDMPTLCATTLRHSYAHWRLISGQDSLTVAKLMGHVDTRMLARRYGHVEGSSFLAAKANEITMPFSMDQLGTADRAKNAEPESTAPAERASASSGKRSARKR